jgi:hypothetical protein
METLTISVNDKSEKGRNFLNFIKSLDFIKIDQPNLKTKKAIDELEKNEGKKFNNASEALNFLKSK